ncbi:MAG: hypothetical protein PHE59_04190 [Patescibacteria group bacterium]|nr:hypothetical protein [Patescibacteria group bacterium]MDD5164860.1 hypothetical protein [Patescibacteria group bacterium]MDD5534465.1 hypothetical protein [Patescibacteria group bacterium]
MLNNINKIKNKWLKNIVKTITIFFLIILILYIGVVIYRIPAAIERQRAEKIVPQIHSQKLTMDDVMGAHLPSEPDSKLNNSTLEGIDANRNGIRDDAELAIFKLYPDSAKIRSGALQYAKGLQMHLRKDITNDDIFIAILQEKSRGYYCFSQAFPSKITKEMNKRVDEIIEMRKKASKFDKNSLEYSNEVWGDPEVVAIQKISSEEDDFFDARNKEIQNLVFNTDRRKQKEDENYTKYSITYLDLDGSECDIDPSTLPN